MPTRENVLQKWDELPAFMRREEVRPYYERLNRKRKQLVIKRCFDITASSVMLLFLIIPITCIGIAIKLDTPGPVFYRQTRITQYGRKFKINKFRTMYDWARTGGSSVTLSNDNRVTRVGRFIRKYRLDELPQIMNILAGEMSFVGTRPEVPKYVKQYKPEYMATLLLPAGVTSRTSIEYKDEARLLENAENADRTYTEKILPEKMKINLKEIKKFSIMRDIRTCIKTVSAVAF